MVCSIEPGGRQSQAVVGRRRSAVVSDRRSQAGCQAFLLYRKKAWHHSTVRVSGADTTSSPLHLRNAVCSGWRRKRVQGTGL